MSRKPTRRAVSKVTGFPAPVKGWSSKNSIAQAEPQTAVIMQNMFPESDAVRVRRGTTSQSTGIGSSVDSLLVYNSATGSKKLFAAKSSAVYNCTSIGAVGAAEFSGMTNGKWQQEIFSTAAGQYLVICNGANGVRTYDGAAWVDQTAAITGTVGRVSSFIHVCAHRSRLWFVDDGTTDLWYLPVTAINGAAVKYPLGAQFKLGGKIVACSTWSSTQGNVSDDKLVIISNQGEILIYSGTDPSGASTWALQLRFVLSPPLGNRCFFTVGADLLILTEVGLFPISQVLEIDSAALSGKALNNEIKDAWTHAVRVSRSAFGWCITTLPMSNMAIINVPAGGADTVQQFVYNVTTGAWGRFLGWSANCWAYLDGAIYFGDGAGNVDRAEYGGSDKGAPIAAYMLPAYDNLGFPGRLKNVSLVRPILSSDVTQSVSIGIAVDYKAPTITTIGIASGAAVFTWDTSFWDGTDLWSSDTVSLTWDGTGNVGTMISPALAMNLDAGTTTEFIYRIISFDIVFEVGDVV